MRTVLDELLADRASLTRRLLGQRADDDADAAGGAAFPHATPAMIRALGASGLPLPPGIQTRR